MRSRTSAKRKPAPKPVQRKPARKPRPRLTAAPPPPPVALAPDAHVQIAIEYARANVAGERVAGRLEILASQRFLRDLERQRTEGFDYVLDVEEAERACRFMENLPHVAGPLAKFKARMVLSPWQCFIVVNLLGWKNATTGFRRFLRALVEVARKNGKSFLASGLALYLLSADDEPGAEIFAAATKRDQAKIVWDVAKRMVLRDSGLRSQVGIQPRANVLVHGASGSTFLPLSADEKTSDGLNPYLAILDELHRHKSRAMYDVLESAFGARDWQLLFQITTAGDDLESICFEQLSYGIDILEGKFEDDTYFVAIYAVDPTDDWTNEACWPKANPQLGISLSIQTLRSECEKAKRVPAARKNFRQKRLNLWEQKDAALFDFKKWCALGDPELKREQFAGSPCVIGIDLASKNDTAARVELFRVGGTVQQPKLAAFCTHYTNEEYVEKNTPVSVGKWNEEGWLKVSEGSSTSQNQIEDELAAAASQFAARELAFDNWQSDGISERLAEKGHTCVRIPINTQNLSTPTKRLQDVIARGDIVHDGNPVFAWNVGNVVGHEDRNQNVLPVREKNKRFQKVDGALALLFAFARVLHVPEQEAPTNESPVEVL